VSERVSEKERESEREEAGGEKDEMASIAIGGVAQAGAVIGAAALMNATRPRDEVEVITGMRSNMGWLARKSNSGATKPVGETKDMPRTEPVKVATPAAAPATSAAPAAKAAPTSSAPVKQAVPDSPFSLFPRHRPQKLPGGPPKPFDTSKAI